MNAHVNWRRSTISFPLLRSNWTSQNCSAINSPRSHLFEPSSTTIMSKFLNVCSAQTVKKALRIWLSIEDRNHYIKSSNA